MKNEQKTGIDILQRHCPNNQYMYKKGSQLTESPGRCKWEPQGDTHSPELCNEYV